MTERFPHLFSPIAVGPYTLRNRIMNTGHAAHHQSGDGTPSEAYVHYLRERAKGGAGIIVTAHTVPVYDGETSLSLTNFHDGILPIYRRIADAVHEFEVPVLAQLGHRGRRVADDSAFIGRPVVDPSAVPPPDFSVPVYMPHELTTAEAEALVESFAMAARRMRRSGFDGVELAVGMDYLFANFLHSHGNRRTDKYGGGTIAERMTFLRETLEAVRAELGAARILGIRLYDDVMDYSLKLADLVELSRLLDRAGLVDYFNIWHGIVPSPKQGRMHWPSYYYGPGAFTYLPEAVKAVVTRPVVGTGRMDSPAVADVEAEWWRMPSAWYDFHFFACLCDGRAYRGPEGLGLVGDDGTRAALIRRDGVRVWGGSGLYEGLEAAYTRWERMGAPVLSSWRMEMVPRGAGLPESKGSDEVFVVERGRSRQVVKKKAREERAEE